MAEVIALWLAALRLAGLLELSRKPEAALAVIGGVGLGAVVYFYGSRLLGSEEAAIVVERLPVPQPVRQFITR